MSSVVDPRAVVRGAAIAAVGAIPAGAIGVATDGPGALDAVLFVIVLAGFAGGGFVAARTASTGPLTSAIGAAALLVLIIEVVGAIRRTAADEDVATAVQIAFLTLVAVTSALGGAMVALRGRGA